MLITESAGEPAPLTAETSTSCTLGFTAETDRLSLTVDFYQIEIDDRFSGSVGELQSFSAIAEFARPSAHHWKSGAVSHFEGGKVVGDDDKFTRRESATEVEVDSLGEADVAQVESGRADVLKFDEFEEVIVIETCCNFPGRW